LGRSIAHALPEQVLIYPSLEAASRQQLKSLGKSDFVSLKQCTIGVLSKNPDYTF
jgi:hypothetical protein